jgi:hypothetical protein
MNSERTSTNSKMKLRRLKKKIYEIRKTAQDIKEESNKENLRKKVSNRNTGNKKFLKSKKKYS